MIKLADNQGLLINPAMDDRKMIMGVNGGGREIVYKVKKLVTRCASYPSEKFEPYLHSGKSKTDKSDWNISIPAFQQNIMFYEHFANEEDLHPTLLAFMYLGGDDYGEINYNFARYSHVWAVEFPGQFKTVNVVYQVIGKLEQCNEVRFYLTNQNIKLASMDPLMYDRLIVKTKDLLNKHPYVSNSVKALRIEQTENIDSNVWNHRTRLDYILLYAMQLFPKLESLAVVGLEANGRTYDLLNNFCHQKGLPKHHITVKEGKASCERVVADPIPCKNLSPVGPNPFIVAQGINSSVLPGTKSVNAGPSPSVNIHDPRLAKRVKMEERNSPRKQETPPGSQNSQETEVLELSPPPKDEPLVINISDEEIESSPPAPKKVKLETGTTKIQLPSPPRSTSSVKSTLSTCSTLPATTEIVHSDALRNIGSSYNDWEDSDGDETVVTSLNSSSSAAETATNTPNLSFVAAAAANIITNVDFNQLKSILNLANAPNSNPVNPRTEKRSVPKSGIKFKEGVHFERRPRR